VRAERETAPLLRIAKDRPLRPPPRRDTAQGCRRSAWRGHHRPKTLPDVTLSHSSPPTRLAQLGSPSHRHRYSTRRPGRPSGLPCRHPPSWPCTFRRHPASSGRLRPTPRSPQPQAHHAPPSRPRVNRRGYKPRTRLLSGYEPDTVPPPTVCADATTCTRRWQGRHSLASRRKGHGKRRTQSPTIAQARATATCPSGLLNPDAEWHGDPDGPSPCRQPLYIYRGSSPEVRRDAPTCAPGGTQTQPPPPPPRGGRGPPGRRAPPPPPRGALNSTR